MADPDPNPNVNLAGSGVVLHVQRPDGELVPVQGTDAGAIAVAGGGGGTSEVTGPGGEELATEVTADRAADAVEALAGTVDGNAIRTTSAQPQFITAPPTDTSAPAMRVVGDGLDRDNNPILRVLPQDGQIVTAVQGDGNDDPDAPAWKVGSLIGGEIKPLATQETAEAMAASLASLDGKTPELTLGGNVPVEVQGTITADTGLTASGNLATEAKQDVGNASLASLDAKAPALVGGRVPVDGSGVTQPVNDAGGSLTVDDGGGSLTIDAASLPLPTGAATSALQGAGLPSAFTAGGGVKVGLVDALPAGSNAIGSVSVTSSALPTGAATEATLAAMNAKIPASPSQDRTTAAAPNATRLSDGTSFYKAASAGDNMGADLRVGGAAVSNANAVPMSDAGASITVDTTQLPAALVGGRLSVDGSGVTQPVSAASLPLPTGAATAANQSTANASLSSIDAGIPAALGQAAAAASMPVVIPTTQSSGEIAQQSTLATRASEASVDQIEGYLDGVEGLLTSIRDQGSLGTAIATTTATVTNTAGQLPSFSAPRGFTVQNPSTNNRSIYVGSSGLVTTSNGYEIQAGTSEDFLLGNANLLFAIAASGSNPIVIAEIH